MSENTVEKKHKTNWFKGLKAEFKKIIWPDKKTLLKQTVAVVICSIVIGLIIVAIDSLASGGFHLFIDWASELISKLTNK